MELILFSMIFEMFVIFRLRYLVSVYRQRKFTHSMIMTNFYIAWTGLGIVACIGIFLGVCQ